LKDGAAQATAIASDVIAEVRDAVQLP
jgi:hypothetical protein